MKTNHYGKFSKQTEGEIPIVKNVFQLFLQRNTLNGTKTQKGH